jgi:hypothetical protein
MPSESRFLLYTDAALKGRGFPGFGGWLHGFFFTMRIPDDLQGYPIVQLEFLAIICAIMTFSGLLSGAPTDLMTDSMTSHLILVNDGAHTDQTQFLHLEFLKANKLGQGKFHIQGARHIFG